jgi:hypothetical protein
MTDLNCVHFLVVLSQVVPINSVVIISSITYKLVNIAPFMLCACCLALSIMNVLYLFLILFFSS